MCSRYAAKIVIFFIGCIFSSLFLAWMKFAIKAPLFLNVAFRVVKDGLLQHEKRPLAMPKAAFHKLV